MASINFLIVSCLSSGIFSDSQTLAHQRSSPRSFVSFLSPRTEPGPASYETVARFNSPNTDRLPANKMNQIMFDGPWAPINEAHADQGNIKARFTCIKSKYSNQRRRSVDNVEAYDIKPVDKFVCGPCVCSINGGDTSVAAYCESRIRNVPTTIPHYIHCLKITHSRFVSFNTSSILIYKSLSYLAINKNEHLVHINYFRENSSNSSLTMLDLSYSTISVIEKNSFKNFINLNYLSLAYNKMPTFTKPMFAGLGNLKVLIISHNLISFLENSTFDYLKQLETLDISKNPLLGYCFKNFPKDLFSPLVNLKQLYLQGNANVTFDQYPNQALKLLKRLNILGVDGLNNSSFNTDLKFLNNLIWIQIGLYGTKCSIKNFQDDFFENTPYLTSISMNNCLMKRMNPKIFLKTKYLTYLAVTNMPNYDLSDAFEDLETLANSSIETLEMTGLKTSVLCRFLNPFHAKYLSTMNLKKLNLSNNNIVMIKQHFANSLPNSLKVLILDNNRINPQFFILQQLSSLTNLDIVSLKSQSHSNLANSFTFEEYGPSNVNRQDRTICERKSEHCQGLKSSDTFDSDFKSYSDLKVWETQGIVLPPNLKHLHAFRFTQFGLILLFQEIRNKSSLYKVDFSSSYTPEWGQGVLPSTVTYANFGANYCRNLTKRFFENNTVLTNLRINDNLLAEVIAADQKGDIFSTLDKLELLDLAENIIYELPFPIMSKLQNLKIIDLSTNKISTLNVSLANCSRLTYIDLSRNSISWITRNTLDDLDTIAANHTIYLDLTFNPLPCTCKGLPIIFWLAHTNVYLLSKDFLTCSDEDNNYIKMGNAEKMLKTLQIHCVSKELTLFICLFSAVCIALVVLLLTMYRFRWRLRYLRTVAIGKLLGFESTLPNNLRYKYDAYILYTDETRSFVLQDCVQELEVNRGHRLCIEERDFMPGTYTVSAIVSAVQNSAKTVPVVTPEFYDGEYAEYGLKMAVMEEIFSRRSVLHLCIYKPVSADDMSRDLLSVLRKNRFTEFPADDEMTPEARLTFWNQMSRSISHNPAED